jgi:hypothetical protein
MNTKFLGHAKGQLRQSKRDFGAKPDTPKTVPAKRILTKKDLLKAIEDSRKERDETQSATDDLPIPVAKRIKHREDIPKIRKDLLKAREDYFTAGMSAGLKRLWRISDALRNRCMPYASDLQFVAIAFEQIADGRDPREALEIESKRGRKKKTLTEAGERRSIALLVVQQMRSNSKDSAIDDVADQLERERGVNKRAHEDRDEPNSWRSHVEECYKDHGREARELMREYEVVEDAFLKRTE